MKFTIFRNFLLSTPCHCTTHTNTKFARLPHSISKAVTGDRTVGHFLPIQVKMSVTPNPSVKIMFLPGNGCTSVKNSNWYGWLASKLGEKFPDAKVCNGGGWEVIKEIMLIATFYLRQSRQVSKKSSQNGGGSFKIFFSKISKKKPPWACGPLCPAPKSHVSRKFNHFSLR